MIQKSRFASNTLVLVAGTSVAHSIMVLVYPFLTRVYTPDDFGILSLFNFIVLIPSIVICWCYDQAIVLPREEKEAASIFVLSLLITCLMSGAIQMFISIFGEKIVLYLKAPYLFPWLVWVGTSLLVAGIYQSLNYWNNRKKHFKRQAISKISQFGITAFSQLGSGVCALGPGGLVLGQLAGQAAASGILLSSSQTGVKSILRHRVRVADLNVVFRKYKNFPLFSTWGNLMNVAAPLIVPVLLSRFFGTSVAGSFFLANRVVTAPIALVAGSIGQVFYQKAAAETANMGTVSSLIEKISSRLILYFILPFIIMVLFAPNVFQIVFGNEWLESGEFVRILAPLCFIQFIVSPLSVILVVLEKQNIILLVQGTLFCGAVGSIGISKYLFDSEMACVSIYSISQFIIYAIYLMAIMRYSRTTVRGIMKEMLSIGRSKMWEKI